MIKTYSFVVANMRNLFDQSEKLIFCKIVNIQATGRFDAQTTLNDL